MKVKITNATIVNGAHAGVGSVCEVDNATAKALLINNKAVPVGEVPEEVMTRGPVTAKPKRKQ